MITEVISQSQDLKAILSNRSLVRCNCNPDGLHIFHGSEVDHKMSYIRYPLLVSLYVRQSRLFLALYHFIHDIDLRLRVCTWSLES